MGGCVIASAIGSQITFIADILPIKKSDLLLIKPIPFFYMIVIWFEKVWLVNKYACLTYEEASDKIWGFDTQSFVK